MMLLTGFVDRILKSAEKINLTLESWLLSFVALVSIRIFLEQYSNYLPNRFVLVDLPTIFHYITFYLAVVLVFVLVILWFTKINLKQSLVLSLFGLIVVVTPPIFDLIFKHGPTSNMSYLFMPLKDMFINYITFFGGDFSSGATTGIKIELIIIFLSVFILVYFLTKKINKAFFSALIIYSVIFIMGSFPSFLFLNFLNNLSYSDAIVKSIEQIKDSIVIINNINPNYTTTPQTIVDLGFNKLMSQPFSIIIILSTFFIFLRSFKDKTLSLISHLRFFRTIFYCFLVLLGLLAGLKDFDFFKNWINVLSLFSLILAFFMSRISAVCINDIEDLEIDKISNKDRPLVTQKLNKEEIFFVAKISFIFAVMLAYSVGGYALFFVIMYNLLSFVYSVPPLRLRRFFLISSFIMGCACVISFLAGFFLTGEYLYLNNFPIKHSIMLLLLFSGASIIKDLKDIDGDKVNGVNTLPTILGATRAKKVLAIAYTISLFIPVILLNSFIFLIPAILFSYSIFDSINRIDYKESRFFKLYLLYMIVSGILSLF